MPQLQRKSQKGFTIIEVMIVLAIAGLILLIVFLAVPALQRNQRNSARRGDASRLAASIIGFVANNSGAIPATAADATSIINDAGKLGQYSLTAASPIGTAADDKVSIIAAGAGTPVALVTTGDRIQIVTGGVCNATGGGATNVGATARSIALQFTLETASGNSTPACQAVQ